MIEIKALKCESCGGALNKDNVCTFCGTRNMVVIDGKKDDTPDVILNNSGNSYSFEVKNINGEIKVRTEKPFEKMVVGLARIQETKQGALPRFIHKDRVYIVSYGYSHMVTTHIDVSFFAVVESLDEFDFSSLQKDTTIAVTLFPSTNN